MGRRPDRSTNRGDDRFGEPSRVIGLCGLFVIGAVLAIVGVVQLVGQSDARAWLLLLVGGGVAVVAAVILKLDPPGGRRR